MTFHPHRLAGEAQTPPRLGGGEGGGGGGSRIRAQQGSPTAAVAVGREEVGYGAEGRPLLQYNPFGADARESTEALVAAAAAAGAGDGGSAEAEAARRQQAMEKRAAAVQEVRKCEVQTEERCRPAEGGGGKVLGVLDVWGRLGGMERV